MRGEPGVGGTWVSLLDFNMKQHICICAHWDNSVFCKQL
jgi:hypothetical protein